MAGNFPKFEYKIKKTVDICANHGGKKVPSSSSSPGSVKPKAFDFGLKAKSWPIPPKKNYLKNTKFPLKGPYG